MNEGEYGLTAFDPRQIPARHKDYSLCELEEMQQTGQSSLKSGL